VFSPLSLSLKSTVAVSGTVKCTVVTFTSSKLHTRNSSKVYSSKVYLFAQRRVKSTIAVSSEDSFDLEGSVDQQRTACTEKEHVGLRAGVRIEVATSGRPVV
jgi:hypothetical protein